MKTRWGMTYEDFVNLQCVGSSLLDTRPLQHNNEKQDPGFLSQQACDCSTA